MIIDKNYVPPKSVTPLPYTPEDHGVGIVHFGVGAFHRAHQAAFTHDVLAKYGGDWRIMGVSLQSTKGADHLTAQDGLYTLGVRDENADLNLRMIGSIETVHAAKRGMDKVFEALANPQTHIVTMTVTEKAYGIDRNGGGIDKNHPQIAHDLQNSDQPCGIIGIIVKGLKMRRDKGINPFTVLCCDNLPQNGELVRKGVIDFAAQFDAALAEWISVYGAFPSTMVDRITPAVPADYMEEVSSILGADDHMAVETEPFSQWVIEDNFCGPRPKWEDVGVLFVDDVAPYERMKLRMLNGAHSLLAYKGFMDGHIYVRDAMADEKIRSLAKDHIIAASKTLDPLAGIDFSTYTDQLIARFKNPNIAHETYQIAMDGSQKMPQRIFEPALDALDACQSLKPFAYAAAAWIFYCGGQKHDGTSFVLRDPRADELQASFKSADNNVQTLCDVFCALPSLMPERLSDNAVWRSSICEALDNML